MCAWNPYIPLYIYIYQPCLRRCSGVQIPRHPKSSSHTWWGIDVWNPYISLLLRRWLLGGSNIHIHIVNIKQIYIYKYILKCIYIYRYIYPHIDCKYKTDAFQSQLQKTNQSYKLQYSILKSFISKVFLPPFKIKFHFTLPKTKQQRVRP